MTRRKLLETAAAIVCEDRNQQYGHPENNFRHIADLWTAYLDELITPVDVACMLALLKVARIHATNGKSADSWVDLAGYAACGAEIALDDEGEDIQC